MKRVILIMGILLLMTITTYADSVEFQQLSVGGQYSVYGDVWIYNHLLNIWERAPQGQTVRLKLWSDQGSGAEELIGTVYTQQGGNYIWSPVFGDNSPEEYDSVTIVFRGNYYHGDYENGARIDIWWIQAH